jgi:hypothetical protein
VRLYPADFRTDFADEMLLTFEAELCDSWREHGSFGLVGVWAQALVEIVTVALPMQLRSGPVVASAASLVGTSAIYLALLWALNETSHIHRIASHLRP